MEIVYVEQVAFDRVRQLVLLQIDFSAAFDHVSHSGLLNQLRAVGVGGAIFDAIACFLSGRIQWVVFNGVSTENVILISGFPRGSVRDP